MARETVTAKHDNIILRNIAHEDKTKSGIILAQPGNYDNLKTERERKEAERQGTAEPTHSKRTNRFEVVAVGDGVWVDAASDQRDGVFLRRPLSVAVGDIVIVEAGPKPFPVNGEILYCAKDHMMLARVEALPDGEEQIVPLNDYIFSTESAHIMQSTGGLYMPGVSDPTGNVRLPVRFRAQEVAEGPWAVCWDGPRDPSFVRRPMAVKPGDEFAFDGRGFEVHVGAKTRVVVQDCTVACVFGAA